jgi:hypothetical protein
VVNEGTRPAHVADRETTRAPDGRSRAGRWRTRRWRRTALVAVTFLTAIVGGLALVPTAHAGTRTKTLRVTTIADLPAAPGACAAKSKTCSLRAAVAQAAQDSAAGFLDTIKLGRGFFQLTGNPATLQITASMNLVGDNTAGAVIDGGGVSTVILTTATAGHVKISKLTITDGGTQSSSFSRGGGIENDGATVDLTNVRVTNSHVTGFGGGILNQSGLMNLTNSEVLGNSSGSQGHGKGAFEGTGGGISNFGDMNIVNSTIANNDGQRGGGIDNEGNVTVAESTISGNTARNSGGGLRTAGGAVFIKFSTIANNFANSTPALGQPGVASPPHQQTTASDFDSWGGEHGGGIVNVGSGNFMIGGSIVATNHDFPPSQNDDQDPSDCYAPAPVPGTQPGTPPVSAEIVSTRNNFFGAVTGLCNFQDIVDGTTDEEWDAYSTDARFPFDPMLGPLGYNSPGTATQTHLPQSGSAVIDGANGQPFAVAVGPGFPTQAANPISPASFFECDAKDQRGAKRPVARYSSFKVCDIGSVEF